ncbi:hypothetical protein PIB30_053635, partial [Stylosanthes scabra]|nr:hypothetical protein [Stylosanthes scabra]
FCERVFKRASDLFENGSFSEGTDSCLRRIDSHDSGLKENVILGLQSRFSHDSVLRLYESTLALLESIPPC